MGHKTLFKSITNVPATLTEPIIEAILNLIRDGKLRQGDKLPPQDALAEQLKVSRTSLREALKELAYRGIVRCVHGKGTFVRERFTSNEEIIEARKIVEPGVAALAARRLKPKECRELERLVEAMRSRVEATDFKDFSMLDLEFHMKINESAKNPALGFMMQTLRDVMLVQQLHLQRLPGAIRRACDFHVKILERMKARDAEGAENTMREHLEDVEAAFRQEGGVPDTRSSGKFVQEVLP
ncbi:MAG: FadR family transcriptional regulator [Synergistaceae bacterium]|nr:FadR family transcriptional regulator [Synergistaceae bacterium]